MVSSEEFHSMLDKLFTYKDGSIMQMNEAPVVKWTTTICSAGPFGSCEWTERFTAKLRREMMS